LLLFGPIDKFLITRVRKVAENDVKLIFKDEHYDSHGSGVQHLTEVIARSIQIFFSGE
jgi:hypothetical protein